MMLVDIGSFVLELIEIESGLINKVRYLTSHNLIVVESAPENERILWVLYYLETSLI
jgi:hypothetical protein